MTRAEESGTARDPDGSFCRFRREMIRDITLTGLVSIATVRRGRRNPGEIPHDGRSAPALLVIVPILLGSVSE